MTRRWRGMADVPLTKSGHRSAYLAGQALGLVDMTISDRLFRCRDTAQYVKANVRKVEDGPLPWDMGNLFQGREITDDSLDLAKYFIHDNPRGIPPSGECFKEWEDRWTEFIDNLRVGFAAVAVITHNRNIQYLYARHRGRLVPHMYDVEGPDFCTIHYYDPIRQVIAPWGENDVPKGVYIIRHGETEFGT